MTDDTLVLGFNDGKITFFKSYIYVYQKMEVQRDLLIVQDKKNGYTGWTISHLSNWKLEHKNDETEIFEINIPMP